MYFGYHNNLLYAACRVTVNCADYSGKPVGRVSGTGFVMKSNSSHMRLVTNRHILNPSPYKPQWTGWQPVKVMVRLPLTVGDDRDVMPSAVTDIELDVATIRFHSDPMVDLAVIRLPPDLSPTVPPAPGSNFGHAIDDNMLATLEDFEGVLHVGEPAALAGFPIWHDKNGDRPILRLGAIVSDPRNDYRVRSGAASLGDGNKQIAVELFAASGNSGGPVFVMGRSFVPSHKTMLLGAVAGSLGDGETANAGLARVFKSSAIIELLQEFDQVDV